MKGELPIRMVMYCPAGHKHVDEGEWATRSHKTHRCTLVVSKCTMGHDDCDFGGLAPCGLEWRAADVPTVGVEEL